MAVTISPSSGTPVGRATTQDSARRSTTRRSADAARQLRRPLASPRQSSSPVPSAPSSRRSARRRGAAAMAASFPNVAVHLAHGNLIEQFMWPPTNHQGPMSGAARWKNRLRLAREVLLAVREAIGPAGHGAALGRGSAGCRGSTQASPASSTCWRWPGPSTPGGSSTISTSPWGTTPMPSTPPGTSRTGPSGRDSGRATAQGMKNVAAFHVFLVGRVNHPQVPRIWIA